jgi:hypothetical protein
MQSTRIGCAIAQGGRERLKNYASASACRDMPQLVPKEPGCLPAECLQRLQLPSMGQAS